VDGSSFSFSPDGNKLVTGDFMEDIITIWNTNNWKKEKTIRLGEKLSTLILKYSPDGETIAVAMDYGIVRLINAKTGKTIVDLISGPKGHWFKRTVNGHYWHSKNKQSIASDLLNTIKRVRLNASKLSPK
jgi:WD40 repeat protein